MEVATHLTFNMKVVNFGQVEDKLHANWQVHISGTIKPLLTHTPLWTAQGMGYEGSILVQIDSVATKMYGLWICMGYESYELGGFDCT